MDKVSVVIVTWNAESFIRRCLDSVFAQSIRNLEVFVVDNGSSDKTVEIVKEFPQRIHLIENNENKGFCFSNNQAIGKAGGDYIFTLNSDIVLEYNYLFELLDFLKVNSEVGMVQGKFMRMDKITIDGLGLQLGIFLRLFNISEGKPDAPEFNRPREIFGPCAAAALYRKKLITEVSFENEVFDERFFFLVEDFDLAWRARNRGWKAMCVPSAVCYHYRESSNHKSGFRQYLSLRNRYYLLIKNMDFSFKSIVRIILAILFYDLPRLLIIICVNRAALKALSDVREYYPQLLKKRYKGTVNK
ncbi:MAG: glycosyltransferase family 2 protein [Candidatus Omnitrophica bacterium]|nr:glycosyltransferase family 2 protein [Candidatus Omnitrophota bacterium]